MEILTDKSVIGASFGAVASALGALSVYITKRTAAVGPRRQLFARVPARFCSHPATRLIHAWFGVQPSATRGVAPTVDIDAVLNVLTASLENVKRCTVRHERAGNCGQLRLSSSPLFSAALCSARSAICTRGPRQ